jgi:hypothetical protein
VRERCSNNRLPFFQAAKCATLVAEENAMLPRSRTATETRRGPHRLASSDGRSSDTTDTDSVHPRLTPDALNANRGMTRNQAELLVIDPARDFCSASLVAGPPSLSRPGADPARDVAHQRVTAR